MSIEKITDEMIQKAIKTCEWRQDVGGIPICQGNVGACHREIEAGRCDTLRRLFEKARAQKND